jgi:hypothetical protein
MLYLRACVNYSGSLWYMFLWYPGGLNLCFPLIRENPKVFTSHTILVFCRMKFQHYSFIKAGSKWNVMHWRSGSRPWTLCSCPWKWCRPSRKLLAKWWSVCWILSVSLKLILCSYGSDHAVLIQYVWKKFIPVPGQISTRLSICGRRSTTHLSFYLVLPSSFTPGISRISAFALHHTNSVEVIPFLLIITLRVLGCGQRGHRLVNQIRSEIQIPLVNVTGRI